MTPVLNNGIFLRDVNMNITSDMDSYHIRNQLGLFDQPADNMGLIELFAMKQKVNVPLYSLASANMEDADYVDNIDGRFTWQVPAQFDLPYIVEDIDPSNTTKGIDGQPFRIKMSRADYGKTDIITYDKFMGLELYILPDREITNIGDGVIYWVQLMNNDSSQYLDNIYLAGGTPFFRVGSAMSMEYGQHFSKINSKGGYREFFNLLPTAAANVEYNVTGKAKMIADGYMSKDGKKLAVTQLWRHENMSEVDPSVNSIESMEKIMGAEYVKKAYNNGDLQMSFFPKMEAAHVNKIALDIENYCIWGKGGSAQAEGADMVRTSVGMWKQLDSAYKFIYNRGYFSLDIFRTQIYKYYNNKEITQDAMPTRVLEVWTGIAGQDQVNRLIGKEAAGLGWIVNADKSGVGAISGESMNLGFGYYFKEIIIPHFAVLRFRINPAFDPSERNMIENPTIDGFPLSSYSYIIHDVDTSRGNIRLKKFRYDEGFKWWYKNGNCDYKGQKSGFDGDRTPGYTVFMQQMHPMLWVKDPTQLLKIVMRNPITGGSM